MDTTVIFVRHGEAYGNYARLYQGWADGDLTEKGHIQAEACAKWLKEKDIKIDVLYSSSLKRTMNTALYISKKYSLPVIPDKQLWEINGGKWENMEWETIETEYKEANDIWEISPHLHQMPEGESMAEFALRIKDEVEKIIARNEGKNICIVTHGNAIKYMISFFLGLDISRMVDIDWGDNTSVTMLKKNDNGYKLILANSNLHLLNENLSTIEDQHWWMPHMERKNRYTVKNRMMEEKIIENLFSTGALKVALENQAFWYTSSTIGPFYVNTHYLFGSEKEAKELLLFIDENMKYRDRFSGMLFKKLENQYNTNKIYRETIDGICDFILSDPMLRRVEFISGGERRDWLFSMLPAAFLSKRHITVYKDKRCYENDLEMNSIEGKVLHAVDLVNEASSFVNSWQPAINALGGKVDYAVCVVDRNQGGEETLKNIEIPLCSMTCFNRDMFDIALAKGKINENQYFIIMDYIKDPKAAMKKFLRENPNFMKESLINPATMERAKKCIEQKIYQD